MRPDGAPEPGGDWLERVLEGDSGAAGDPELAPLAEFVHAVRRQAAVPVPPSATLAVRMATGFASARARCRPIARPRLAEDVRALRHPSRGRTRWVRGPRQRAGAGRSVRLAVQVAAVVAVSVLGVSSAGFAQVLPGPAQVRFETVVEAVTPYTFPPATTEPVPPDEHGPADPHPAGEPPATDERGERRAGPGSPPGTPASDRSGRFPSPGPVGEAPHGGEPPGRGAGPPGGRPPDEAPGRGPPEQAQADPGPPEQAQVGGGPPEHARADPGPPAGRRPGR